MSRRSRRKRRSRPSKNCFEVEFSNKESKKHKKKKAHKEKMQNEIHAPDFVEEEIRRTEKRKAKRRKKERRREEESHVDDCHSMNEAVSWTADAADETEFAPGFSSSLLPSPDHAGPKTKRFSSSLLPSPDHAGQKRKSSVTRKAKRSNGKETSSTEVLPNDEDSNKENENVQPIQELMTMIDMHVINPKIRSDSDLEKEDLKCQKRPKLMQKCMRHSFLKLPEIDAVRRPLPNKLVSWILDHDFPIPKIQFMFFDTFGSPTQVEAKRMKKENPDYDWKHFDVEEDAVIVQRLSLLFKAVGFTAKEGWKAINQISKFTKKGNRHYSRLILGAYVGRPLLLYRRMYHVYQRLLKLAQKKDQKHFSEDDSLSAMLEWLSQNGPKYDECLKHFKMGLRMTRKQLRHLHVAKEKKIANSKLKTGYFSPEEEQKLVSLVMRDQKVTEISELTSDQLNWKAYAKAFNRTEAYLKRHWDMTTWPILAKYVAGVEYKLGFESKVKLLDEIIKSGAKKRKEVNFKKLHKLFPYETRISIRSMLAIALKKVEVVEGEDFLEHCKRVKEAHEESALSEQSRKTNAGVIVTAYEDALVDLGLK